MNTKMKLTMVAAASVAAAQASALITITPGPGNFPGDENILFNVGSLIQTGPLIEGITNQTNFVVNFSQAGENLTSPSGGQARVEAVDGGMTDMRLSFADPNVVFQTLIWDLNSSADGFVTFTVHRTGGPDVQGTYEIDQAGSNWFRFEATGESMIWVSLDSTVDLQDVRQTRIGGAHVVPEPASLAMLGIGAVAFVRRKQLRTRS